MGKGKKSVVLICLVLILLNAGCTQKAATERPVETTPTPAIGIKEEKIPESVSTPELEESTSETIFYFDEQVIIGDFSYTFHDYETASYVGGQYFSEAADGKFAIFDVTIENMGKESLIFLSSYVRLRDEAGRYYDSDIAAEMYLTDETTFSLKQMQPTLPVRGKIVFDVPTDFRGLIYIESNRILSDEIALVSWKNLEKEGTSSGADVRTVSKVLSGNTFLLSDGTTEMIDGINVPDEGQKYYEESVRYAENLILDKNSIYVTNYPSTYTYSMIAAGYATISDVGAIYYRQWSEAEDQAKKDSVGIWATSTGWEDLSIERFLYSSSDPAEEYIQLKNRRAGETNLEGWIIRDSGGASFDIPVDMIGGNERITIYMGKGEDAESTFYMGLETDTFNNEGGTIFIQDNDGFDIIRYSYW